MWGQVKKDLGRANRHAPVLSREVVFPNADSLGKSEDVFYNVPFVFLVSLHIVFGVFDMIVCLFGTAPIEEQRPSWSAFASWGTLSCMDRQSKES